MFNKDNIIEFKSYEYIDHNIKNLNGVIIHFPFKNLCYKSFNFFWYFPNCGLNEIKIENLLELIKKKERKNGTTFIEGVEVPCDGEYKLSFIDFKNLKYSFHKNNIKDKLELIYLELFL